jgi:hypothetical protein
MHAGLAGSLGIQVAEAVWKIDPGAARASNIP